MASFAPAYGALFSLPKMPPARPGCCAHVGTGTPHARGCAVTLAVVPYRLSGASNTTRESGSPRSPSVVLLITAVFP